MNNHHIKCDVNAINLQPLSLLEVAELWPESDFCIFVFLTFDLLPFGMY